MLVSGERRKHIGRLFFHSVEFMQMYGCGQRSNNVKYKLLRFNFAHRKAQSHSFHTRSAAEWLQNTSDSNHFGPKNIHETLCTQCQTVLRHFGDRSEMSRVRSVLGPKCPVLCRVNQVVIRPYFRVAILAPVG